MNIFKSKKKEEPKKKVTVTIEQLNMLFMKSREYINLDKQKKINEAMMQENKLLSMLKAPQRNRKDEEIQIIRIVNLINTIEAYDKAIIQISNIDQFKSQIVASQGDPNRVLQFIPYIASVCYYIEQTHDLRGAADLKYQLNDYYGCDIANTYEKSVDPSAKTLFGILNLQSPSVQKYAQDFGKKYQVLDVPGLNYQPQQQQPAWNPAQYPQPQQGGPQQGGNPQQGGGYPQQGGGYPQQGGGYPQQNGGISQQQSQPYPQQQPQPYPQQGNYQQSYQQSQQPSYQQQIPQQNNYVVPLGSNPYGLLQQNNQQNIYQNNPNVYQPQISQPQIGLNPKQNSNFNYPQQHQSIYNAPSQTQNNNIGFIPLQQQSQQQNQQCQSQQQQVVDPFALLNESGNQKMVELPPLPKQSTIQPNNPLNKNGDGFASNLPVPADEQVPFKSQNSQDKNNNGNFGSNNPLGNSINSRGTQLTDPLNDQNMNIFETTTIGQDMTYSQPILNDKRIEEIPIQINHDLRSLEILHKFKTGFPQSINDSLSQLQKAGLSI